MTPFTHGKLSHRLIIIYVTITLISIGIIGYLGFRRSREALKEATLRSIESEMRQAGAGLLSFMESVRDDLTLLRHSHAVAGVIRAREDGLVDQMTGSTYGQWVDRLQNLFESLLKTKRRYMSIRYLDETGQELVRVDAGPSGAAVVIEGEASRKETSYFRGAVKLVASGVFVSKVSLLRENGLIAMPPQPTVHYAAPVFDAQDVNRGAVVMAVSLANALDRLEIARGQTYLVNEDGYFLKHPDRSRECSFEFGSDFRLQQEFPELIPKLVNDFGAVNLDARGTTFGYKRLPVDADRAWLLFGMLPDGVVFSGLERLKFYTILISLTVAICVFIATYFVSTNITTPIRSVAAVARRVAENDLSVDMPEQQRSDEIGELIRSFHLMIENLQGVVIQANQIASGDFSAQIKPRSGNDKLGIALAGMTESLRRSKDEEQRQSWLKSGQSKLNDEIRGESGIQRLCEKVITFLTTYLHAHVGAIYLYEEDGLLHLAASYAYQRRKDLSNRFHLGESLLGQAALEKKTLVISSVPEDYIRIQSALGDARPGCILVAPCIYENALIAVIELGAFSEFDDQAVVFMEQAGAAIAVTINMARNRIKTENLLKTTEEQAADLKLRQEELQSSNEELEEQSRLLKESESRLKEQQEELQAANEELEEKTNYLQEQRLQLTNKNAELEEARLELEKRAEEIEIASKYKSEFLANMSHELRTPLNSILILSKLMANNTEGTLSDEEVQNATVIYRSGSDLLNLINEILDLSKIEAGRVELDWKTAELADLITELNDIFLPVAEDKGLAFNVRIADEVPAKLKTDRQRLLQIVKNLMSNAFKFTSEGSVSLDVSVGAVGSGAAQSIAFSISDTGIGIAPDKQALIFEAFQQAEGGTNRKYGGTGLGLSISRELAKLLGGQIDVFSEEGQGSTFTFRHPINADNAGIVTVENLAGSLHRKGKSTSPAAPGKRTEAVVDRRPLPTFVADDRDSLTDEDVVILIIDDDANFAGVMRDLVRRKGYRCVIAGDGESGVRWARRLRPQAVLLDIKLPGMDGWQVMEELRNDPGTSAIPVHFISVLDDQTRALEMGAIGYLTKPVDPDDLNHLMARLKNVMEGLRKELLIIEDDVVMQNNIAGLTCDRNIEVTSATTGVAALEALAKRKFDCIILDLNLPDISGFDLLHQIKNNDKLHDIPIIVYTARELSREEDRDLAEFADSIIVKNMRSPERLLDDIALFLHKVQPKPPSARADDGCAAAEDNGLFQGRKILVVDDDMRNGYAISKLLKGKGMITELAENGEKALSIMKKEGDSVDLILMDIMMPVLDGYEAMRQIRANEKFQEIPIIALTAKAMKGDRDKCVEAGANDYLSKPLDIDKLLSLLRVWLSK